VYVRVADPAILNVDGDIMITRFTSLKGVQSKRRFGLLGCISTGIIFV
jgi:hypothetical protein